jgi:flavin reductase (DIM6/NTAB) family NADH-FMN oxidoreductase RutF
LTDAESSPVDPLAEACRALMSCFPTGVAVVSSLDPQARPCGLTCSSLISVTLTPPTLLVSVHLRSSTLAAAQRLGGFAVNLLPARAREVAELFASGRPDRFQLVRWRPRGSLGLPWLVDDCSGWAECALSELFVVGDHALMVGRVIDAQSTSEVPLLYGFREFAAWPPPLAGAA